MGGNRFARTVYSLRGFLGVDVALWGNRLKEHHLDCMQEEAGLSQKKAWYECFKILRGELAQLPLSPGQQDSIFLVFEYELPRERGRRPDVLLLSGGNLVVLEFKGRSAGNQAHIDQAKHYARDLRSYHAQSHGLDVVPVLVVAEPNGVSNHSDGVAAVSGDRLHQVLAPLLAAEPFPNIQEWFESEYAPLPSLLQSAQLLFREKSFPHIKRAHSAGIPSTLRRLAEIAQLARQTQTHHLALITGVPGAGKTLVGLQFVFETYGRVSTQKAVFLSGNGPLVDVLQFSLGNRHFVQSVHGFLKQYAYSKVVPSEDVIIYDEAQRAWDSEKVSNSKREGNNAEPTDFLNIGDRKNHCLLIGLIGEGQEIHLGEESGMALWEEAVRRSPKRWVIHCPEKLQHLFPGLGVENAKEFNLTTSLRTHQALTLQTWVESLLENDIPKANGLSVRLRQEGYPIYVTRILDKAKEHVRDKYADEPSKTYGLIASSKGKLLPRYGIFNDYDSTRSFTVSQYYVDSGHRAYCRNLATVVTEFGCQGLELDMPLLAWDNDFVYADGWRNTVPNKQARDAARLRKNSYRVLLTRGRDGLVVFVPEDRQLDPTFQVLLAAGCVLL